MWGSCFSFAFFLKSFVFILFASWESSNRYDANVRPECAPIVRSFAKRIRVRSAHDMLMINKNSTLWVKIDDCIFLCEAHKFHCLNCFVITFLSANVLFWVSGAFFFPLRVSSSSVNVFITAIPRFVIWLDCLGGKTGVEDFVNILIISSYANWDAFPFHFQLFPHSLHFHFHIWPKIKCSFFQLLGEKGHHRTFLKYADILGMDDDSMAQCHWKIDDYRQ